MLGMIEGNGHPYSWSAIINGYNWDAMMNCPYPAILNYLGPLDPDTVGFEDASVTHIWTDDPEDAPKVAEASLIPNILRSPEEAIGEVDAVVVATDDGTDHVRRCRPFIEAGVPVFIDKPMATTPEELDTFLEWDRQGARFLSSSGMRYDPEMIAFRKNPSVIGDLRWISSFTAKTWERYGIHALEFIYPILGPGFETIRLESFDNGDIAYLTHRSGVKLTLPAIHDAYGAFGKAMVAGTSGARFIEARDTYTAFRDQLRSYVDYLTSDRRPFPFEETVELMRILIAGIQSRDAGSTTITIES